MKVQDVMTSNVQACQPETNLATAAALMWENDCGALPVVDHQGKVMGMITDRDICIAAATKGRPAWEITVNDVFSGQVYTSALDEDIKTALKTMQHHKVRRLPVINREGLLQGIVSINDITLRAEEARGTQVPDLSYEDVVSTFKAICEHRHQAKSAGAA
jgi:CBS domain-containing protein